MTTQKKTLAPGSYSTGTLHPDDCQITTGGLRKPTMPVKLVAMLRGERVIMSDAELDALSEFDESNYVRSIPNPRQVGTLDQYECWIDPGKRLCLNLLGKV